MLVLFVIDHLRSLMSIDTSKWPIGTIEIKTRNPGVFKAVTICDPHLCAHSPAVYKEDYWTIAKETMAKIFRFAVKEECDVILWAGDIFHLKTPIRNPLWFMTEVVQMLRDVREQGVKHLGIAGNHDVKYGSVSEGLRGQPLEVLYAAGVYSLLDKEEWLFDTGTKKIRVAGGSYLHGSAEHVREKKKQGADYLITLGHFWFGRQSGEFFGEQIFGPDYLHSGETDIYVIGHHHEDQGVPEVGGKLYFAHGSSTRTGAHKHDIERRPAAGFISITDEGVSHKVVRPKVPAVEDVMDLEKREIVMAEKKKIDDFIRIFSQSSIDASDPKKMLDTLALNLDQKVKDRVLEYLDQAEQEA